MTTIKLGFSHIFCELLGLSLIVLKILGFLKLGWGWIILICFAPDISFFTPLIVMGLLVLVVYGVWGPMGLISFIKKCLNQIKEKRQR